MASTDRAETIRVNGTLRPFEHAALTALLRALGQDPERSGTAVAVNGRVVPRGEWVDFKLVPGDEVEIVTAVQGG